MRKMTMFYYLVAIAMLNVQVHGAALLKATFDDGTINTTVWTIEDPGGEDPFGQNVDPNGGQYVALVDAGGGDFALRLGGNASSYAQGLISQNTFSRSENIRCTVTFWHAPGLSWTMLGGPWRQFPNFNSDLYQYPSLYGVYVGLSGQEMAGGRTAEGNGEIAY